MRYSRSIAVALGLWDKKGPEMAESAVSICSWLASISTCDNAPVFKPS